MHLFNKCCAFPQAAQPCCYPQHPYLMQQGALFGPLAQPYGRQQLQQQQVQYPAQPVQPSQPVFDNRPTRRSKG